MKKSIDNLSKDFIEGVQANIIKHMCLINKSSELNIESMKAMLEMAKQNGDLFDTLEDNNKDND